MSAGRLPFEAGVWEQGAAGDGFAVWSGHYTLAAARAAAVRYARKLSGPSGARTGGALSWAGGYRAIERPVKWVDWTGAAPDSRSWAEVERDRIREAERAEAAWIAAAQERAKSPEEREEELWLARHRRS